MPLYRYVCESGYTFEKKGGFDDKWVDCPKCKAPAMRQATYPGQGIIIK